MSFLELSIALAKQLRLGIERSVVSLIQHRALLSNTLFAILSRQILEEQITARG